MAKIAIKNTIMALYYGNRSIDDIQQVLHLLGPDDDFHSIRVNFIFILFFNYF